MNLASLALFAGLAGAGTAAAQDAAPASADTFEREALTTLKASHANKRGVVLHVGGQKIPGIVKAIGPDSVVLANQEHARIVVRRERIDAVEAD
jgi:hypothetical protein